MHNWHLMDLQSISDLNLNELNRFSTVKWSDLIDWQYEQRHRLEALRMRDQEERQLKKSGNKRYKEVAEQHYRVR